MDKRAQQEKGHCHTLGWRPQGCPIQGEGSQGAVVATCRMASPRTPRDPTQAPVTLNRTRPTLGSPPSAPLPAPRGTQFPGEPRSQGGRHANSLKAGPQPVGSMSSAWTGPPIILPKPRGSSHEAARPGLPESGHHNPEMRAACRNLHFYPEMNPVSG